MRYTLEDVVDFCWEHRGLRAFKDFTYENIVSEVVSSADEQRLVIVVDNQGICGAVIFSVAAPRLYIHQIVSVRSGFAALVEEALRRYPDHTITGSRKGKLKQFTPRTLWAIAHQAQTIKPKIF